MNRCLEYGGRFVRGARSLAVWVALALLPWSMNTWAQSSPDPHRPNTSPLSFDTAASIQALAVVGEQVVWQHAAQRTDGVSEAAGRLTFILVAPEQETEPFARLSSLQSQIKEQRLRLPGRQGDGTVRQLYMRFSEKMQR